MVTLKSVCLLGLLWTSVVVATLDGLKPSSFPSTLPPAKPTGSNDPCAFSDLQELVDRLEENPALYNTTLMVETCDDICQLVYGTGNPDISGIGASSHLDMSFGDSLTFAR